MRLKALKKDVDMLKKINSPFVLYDKVNSRGYCSGYDNLYVKRNNILRYGTYNKSG